MADISSYPRKLPKVEDLVLFSETYDANAVDPAVGNPTKLATIQDIIDLVPSGGGGGSVSSVAATGFDGISVIGSPITSSGTLFLSLTDGGIPTAKLASNIITINGTSVSLGGSIDIATITPEQASAIVDNTNNIVINATSISTETASRISADSFLQQNIDNEATARTNADIALQNQITSNDTDITNLQTTKQNLSEKNQANGYAPLDSGAKIPLANLPDSILGQLEYKGTWNANTNTPTLPSASTAKGNYYVTSVAGVYSTVDYAIGDWVVSNGAIWEKVDNSDAVTTVFGRLGNVVANESDYSGFYPLISDLNTETTNRISADTTLQNNINSEASTRAAADAALQTEIDNIVEANDATITIASGTYLTGGAAFTLNQAANETITLNVTATDLSTASTIAARDASGDLQARLFRSEYDTTNATVGLIMTQVDTVSNNYIRPTTPTQFRTAVTDGYYAPATGGSYLPLAGGTLTGALIGTSATFAGNVSATGGASNGGTINIGDTAAYRGILTYSGASQTNFDIINSYTSATARINFKLGTAGTPITAMTILGDGNVGIGTTSPSEKLEVVGNVVLDVADARLKIKGGVAGTNSGIDWTFNTDSTAYAKIELDYDTRASTGFLIDSGYPMTLDYSSGSFSVKKNGSSELTITNGNVGIGTTNPTAPLDVFGVRAGRDWALADRAVVRLDSNGTNYTSDILFGHTAAANETGWTGAYWSLSSRSSSADNKFYFYRGGGNPDGTGEAVIMTFDPNLNVGIGTTNPSSLLHLQSASSPTLQIKDTTNNVTFKAYAQDGNSHLANTSNHDLFIDTNNTPRITVKAGGSVGIGTTSPFTNRALSVAGHIEITGNFYSKTGALELGQGRTSNGVAYIDLTGQSGTGAGTDYGLRLIRNSGANASSDIIHIGTGNLNITAGTSAFSGTVSATSFSGSGSSITNVNAASVDGYSVWSGTQAAYNALTPDANTIYHITA